MNGIVDEFGRALVTLSIRANRDVEPTDITVFRISDLAVDTGLADLASNVDHYLYGHPKTDDGK